MDPIVGDPSVARHAPEADPADGWSVVPPRRKKALRDTDATSLVLWGVPPSTPAKALWATIQQGGIKATSLQWRGHSKARHLVLHFGSTVSRSAQEVRVSALLSPLGVRAVRARDWELREQQRQQVYARPHGMPRARDARFLPLGTDEEAQEQQAPHRRKRKKKKSVARKQKQACFFKHSKILACSLNVNKGLNKKVAELEDHFLSKKADIVAIQEAGLRAGNSITFKGYRTIVHPNGNIILLIANRLVPFLVEEKRGKDDADNQLWATLTGEAGQKHLHVCSAYMLQETAPLDVRERAFSALGDGIGKHLKTGEVMLLGDLNAKIGRPKSKEETHLFGKHGQPVERSGNGELLAQSLVQHKMLSLGGQRPPPDLDADGCGFWYTRYDVPQKAHHAIDYVAVSQGVAAHHPKFQVDYTELNSDHHLLCAEVTLPRRTTRRRGRNKPRRAFRLGKLIQKSSKPEAKEEAAAEEEAYEKALKQSFADFDVDSGQQVVCDCLIPNCCCAVVRDFITRTEEALENSVGSRVIRRKFSRSWFDDEVKAAIAQRREAYNNFKSDKSLKAYKVFRKARRACNRLTGRKQADAWNEYLANVEDARRNDPKRMCDLIKRLIPNSKKATIDPILKRDGSLALSEDDIVEAWAAHVEHLGTPTEQPLQNAAFKEKVESEVQRYAALSPSISDTPLDEEFTLEEVKEVLQKADYGKACSTDGTKNTCSSRGGRQCRFSSATSLTTYVKKNRSRRIGGGP